MQAHDVDGDGDQDLLSLSNGDRFLLWRNSDGLGTFGAAEELLVVPEGVAHFVFEDLDQDGAVDLLLIRYDEEVLFVAWNLGTGTFAPAVPIGPLPGTVGALRCGDLSGSGWPDPVVSIATDGTAGIAFWPNTNGSFAAPVIHADLLGGDAPTVMEIGDLNGDSTYDVFLIASDMEALGFFNSTGDGSAWSRKTLFYNYDYPYAKPLLIDVDSDGDLDIAEANGIAVQWAENRLNEPSSNFSLRILEPFTTAGKGSFAALGCGGVGLVYIPSNPALPVRWSSYLATTTRFAPRADLSAIPRAHSMTLADLNGDGKPDLILVDQENGASWYANSLVPPTTEVLLPSLDTLCIFGPSVTLPAAIPEGGQWTGTWVQNNVLYRSNASGTGDYPITYTLYEPEGCPVGDRAFVRLLSGPTISPVLPPVLCSAQRPIQMSATPANVEWVGLTDGILDPTTYTGDLIVAVYTDLTGSSCVTFLGPLNIWPSVSAGIQEAGPFCTNAGPQTILPVVDLPGSSWSGDITSSTNGQAIFDPSIGAGEYLVILDRVPGQPQQCANSDTLRIVVSDEFPSVAITPMPVFCADGPLVPLQGGTPQGGTWSGTGVSNDALDPAEVAPGAHVVTYSFTSDGGCSASATSEVLLLSAATVGQAERAFCPTDEALLFSAEPVGGTWSAPLNAEGLLDPGTVAPGRYPLEYTYTAPNACVLHNAADTLEVFPQALVLIDPIDTLCENGEAVVLTGSPSGVWSGSVNGNGSSVVFDPTALGLGQWPVVLSATDANGCSGESSVLVLVDICSGITDTQAVQALELAPNPFVNSTVLSFDAVGSVEIRVMDMAGRPIQEHRIMANGPTRWVLDLGDEASGMHVIRVQYGDELHYLRALKAR